MHIRLTIAAALGLAASIGSIATAAASDIVTFTWDPALASPPLTGAGSAITADGISVTNYLHSVNTNDFATLRQNFVEQLIQPITGFTLHGSPVSAPPGLNSNYGLYFTLSGTGHFPIDATGATVGPATFDSLSMTLTADVNHDDGTVGSTLSGVAFSNPAGVGNDVVLATGSLRSAALSRDAQGVRHAHFTETFVPDAAEAGFFVNPDFSLGWDELLTTLPAAFQVLQVDPLTTVQMVNGQLGSTGQATLIPEPSTGWLLLAGCVALAAGVARRWRVDGAGAAPD